MYYIFEIGIYRKVLNTNVIIIKILILKLHKN